MRVRHEAMTKICSVAFAVSSLLLTSCGIDNPQLIESEAGANAPALADGTTEATGASGNPSSSTDGTTEAAQTSGAPSKDARAADESSLDGTTDATAATSGSSDDALSSDDSSSVNPDADARTETMVPESGSLDATLDGADAMACSATSRACDGGCFANNDPTHCGSCSNDCSKLPHVTGAVSCQSGQCSLASACSPGWADCNSDPTDGCETDTTTATHCGSCTLKCQGGTPVCSLATGTTRSCTSGCPSSAPTLCGTTCSDTTSDSKNCSKCTNACSGGKECQSSTCVCPAGSHDCNGTCASNTSTNSCGTTSCSACPAPASGTATCNGTSCGQRCSNAQQTVCGAACVDLLSDNSNCGFCGRVCGTGQCTNGACVVPQVCGDGIVSGTEECDPKGPGFNAFNCSPQCTKITSYTQCGPNWPPCLNGTVCGTLGMCTRTCASTSDCDTVAGYPGLMINCPIPLGTQCVISCMTGQDCPPSAICNGGETCQIP